ncbi:hypothetical protein ONS96_011592 [Cadophora gregata f. sp. sojae]|nr:hypothetical protein ONS96_011592 [Cadophora gregata f. sp. sojae]
MIEEEFTSRLISSPQISEVRKLKYDCIFLALSELEMRTKLKSKNLAFEAFEPGGDHHQKAQSIYCRPHHPPHHSTTPGFSKTSCQALELAVRGGAKILFLLLFLAATHRWLRLACSRLNISQGTVR